MNKVILYICMGMLFLTACSPYGLTGGPDSDSDDSEPTPEEIAAIENMKTFSLTIEQFEKNMQTQSNDAVLNETEMGYETKDHLIKIDYKDDSTDANDPLTYIYILIDQPSAKFTNIEKECIATLEMLFASLEVSYDVNQLVTSVKENKIEAMNTEDVMVELTNNSANIQMTISPK
ncbi:hypothetical protein [Bacillus norwichensis]|uniref:Lipoprotein n=1 Tax=Bacillus norwichensis TaxID=2762217 RepID=A0ABR8VS76_9BACI|nr:hypothetical protein [Bacillus norwichensis]MBD8007615.1 hypothetical protein [Bacillus norwichensis]